MKSTFIWIIIGVMICGNKVSAWGGLFNRFSPEMLANMGYGGNGGHRGHPFFQKDGYVEEDMNIESEPCYGRRCSANEHCCVGSICVDVDGVHGNCLFFYGAKLGELCRKDEDCENGLNCDVSPVGGASVCRVPIVIGKQYAEDCETSSDCDITRGLCCQVQRRHRQVSRKVCSYFKDPLTCIGRVQIDQIKFDVQHTAGEKRITSPYKPGLN